MLRLGQLAGEAKASVREANRKERQEAVIREEKNRRELIEFNAKLQLDRQKFQQVSKFSAEQRAQQWEVEKMSLRSQADFQREEADRQQKLGSIDKKLMALEKEKQAGRFGEDESAYSNAINYWTAQKDFINTGTKAPTIPWYQHPSQFQEPGAISERATQEAKAQGTDFGVEPYWMKFKDAPEDSTEKAIYDAKVQETTQGYRTGTRPTHLDPTFMRKLPKDVAMEILASQEIFVDSPEELDSFLQGLESEDPANTGVQVPPKTVQQGQLSQQSVQQPVTVSTDAEYLALPNGTPFITPDGKRGIKGKGR